MAIKSKIKGKKKHTNKPTSAKYKKYTVEGDKIIKKARSCPRCGPGIFLMKAEKRVYCGKCHYSEFESKGISDKEDKIQEQK